MVMKVLSIVNVVCFCVVVLSMTFIAYAQEAEVKKKSKIFPPERIEELEEPREWQKPEQIMEFLDIEHGYVVADIGTGAGYFALYFSDWVGENGIVYAEDIQQEMVDYTAEKIKEEGIENIKVVLGKPDDPGFPEGSLDLAFMGNVYHEVENPAALLKSISRSLKPGGMLVIIDWRKDRESDFGPPMDERVARNDVEIAAEEAGYYTVRYHPFLRQHYFLIFKVKPQ